VDLNDEDRILIENLYVFKGYGTKKLITEFPNKGWGLNKLPKSCEKSWHGRKTKGQRLTTNCVNGRQH